VARTKELKQRYGAEEGDESIRQFWKEPSRERLFLFQLVFQKRGSEAPPYLLGYASERQANSV